MSWPAYQALNSSKSEIGCFATCNPSSVNNACTRGRHSSVVDARPQATVKMVFVQPLLSRANRFRQLLDAPRSGAGEPLLLVANEVLPLTRCSYRGGGTCVRLAHFGSPRCVLKNVAVLAHRRSITTGSDVYMCVTPGSGSDSKSRPARKSALESFSVCR